MTTPLVQLFAELFPRLDPLHPWQIAAITAIESRREEVVEVFLEGSRGGWKSTFTEQLALAWSVQHPNFTTVITGPTRSQAEQSWRGALKIVRLHPLIADLLDGEPTSHAGVSTMRFRNGSEIMARTATPDSSRGVHANAVIVTEFRSMLRRQLDAVKPYLSTKISDRMYLVLETSGGDEGSFAFQKRQEFIDAADRLFLSYPDHVLRASGFKLNWEMIDRDYRDDPVMAAKEYGCNWIIRRGGLFTPEVVFNEALLAGPFRHKAVEGRLYGIGVDLAIGATERSDFSTYTVLEADPSADHWGVVDLRQWRRGKRPLAADAETLLNLLAAYPGAIMVLDFRGGSAEAVYSSHLKPAGYGKPGDGGLERIRQAPEGEEKVKAFLRLWGRMQSPQQFSFPEPSEDARTETINTLRRELCMLETERTRLNQRLKIGSKFHDDLAHSLVFAVLAIEEVTKPIPARPRPAEPRLLDLEGTIFDPLGEFGGLLG